jgi:acetolactate synthase-1/2/3 large subunit
MPLPGVRAVRRACALTVNAMSRIHALRLEEDDAPRSTLLPLGTTATEQDRFDEDRQSGERTSYVREILGSPATATAGRRIVEALLSAGVDTFFGVPGGPISPLFEAVLETEGATLVESRHESTAAFAAMGFYRATGRVPGLLVTAGPGATNAVTGVAAAFTERVPMMVIAGDVAWSATGGRMAQDSGPEGLDLEHMFERITRTTKRAARPASAATQALAVLKAATDPLMPGPALFVVPMDVGRADAPEAEPPSCRVTMEAAAPWASVRKAARLLATAKRPLVRDRRRRAPARRRGAPAARCAQRAVHDHAAGEGPRQRGAPALAAQRRARGVVVGASLHAGRLRRGAGARHRSGRLVRGPHPPHRPRTASSSTWISIRRCSTATTAPSCPSWRTSGAFARELYEVVTAEGLRNPSGGHLAREIHATSPFDSEDFASDASEKIAPHRAVADLERAAGPDARFVSDIGEHMLSALHYLTATGPDRVHDPPRARQHGLGHRLGDRAGARRSGPPRGVHLRRRRHADGGHGDARRGERAPAHRVRGVQRRALQHGLPRLQTALRQGGRVGDAVGRLRHVGAVVRRPRARASITPGRSRPSCWTS